MLVIAKEYCKGYGKVEIIEGVYSWASKVNEELIELDADFKYALTIEDEEADDDKNAMKIPWRPDLRFYDAIRNLLM
jgi:hypothetical protein